ncbi:MAG: DUF3052 family protein [Betaproteobacteria bacterium]|nr:DUF3052 family protein [Betaproteobacteria bacterium]
MATSATAGYSGTPLPKKLGLKDGGTLVLLNAPDGIEHDLVPLPPASELVSKLAALNELVLLFCKDTAALKKSLPTVSKKLHADGSLWISWPKKTSKLFVDLTEDGIRAIVLPTGLVDVKVCAVNADWSGLKLMVRKELRPNWNK